LNTTDYNIAKVPIKDGVDNYPLASSKNYLILLSAPAGAKVTVRLNDTTEDEIPLSENFALECKNVSRVYISCNAVDTDEMLVLGQAATSEDFKIITAPVVKDIDSINNLENLGSPVLEALDKIIQPYEHISTDLVKNITTSQVTIFNSTLNCDKIKIDTSCYYNGTSDYHYTVATLDGVLITHTRSSLVGGAWLQELNSHIELENVRGKVLNIVAIKGNATIQQFNKKV